MNTTMIALIAGCVCNIALDPVLIFGLGPVPAWALPVQRWPQTSASSSPSAFTSTATPPPTSRSGCAAGICTSSPHWTASFTPSASRPF